MIRIVIADDEPLARRALVRMLRDHDDVKVVDGEEIDFTHQGFEGIGIAATRGRDIVVNEPVGRDIENLLGGIAFKHPQGDSVNQMRFAEATAAEQEEWVSDGRVAIGGLTRLSDSDLV